MSKIKLFLLVASIGCIVLNASPLPNDHEESRIADESQLIEKRILPVFFPLIAAGISAGASLVGTTVSGLMAPGFNVATSGSIENFSAFNMKMMECTPASGFMNKPMVSVGPGKREGFASHKTGNAATGTHVYCLYKVHGSYVHIMYSVPYSFDLHSNWLALAITPSGWGNKLDADKMYDNEYSYMAKTKYYNTIKPTRICRQDLCIKGTMGTSHKPTIDIKLYPRTYKYASPTVKKSFKNIPDASAKYDEFIQEEFL